MAVAKGQLIFNGYHTKPGTNDMVEPATYSVAWGALADDATSSDAFKVDSSYDFHLLEMTHVVEGIAQGAHVPLIIQAQGENDRPWFIQPVYINTVSSLQNAGQPRKLPVKRIIPTKQITTVIFYEATNL